MSWPTDTAGPCGPEPPARTDARRHRDTGRRHRRPFRQFPAVAVLLDDVYLGLRRDHPGQAITPPRKPNKVSAPEVHEARERARHEHSSQCIPSSTPLPITSGGRPGPVDPPPRHPPRHIPRRRRPRLRPHRHHLTERPGSASHIAAAITHQLVSAARGHRFTDHHRSRQARPGPCHGRNGLGLPCQEMRNASRARVVATNS
jgi:hypothetical protein